MTSTHPLNRRQFLARSMAALGTLAIGGCGEDNLLRVGSNTWPGYELLYIAQRLGLVEASNLRMVRMPSSTATLQSLAGGKLDAAGLTLDEVLTARADGIDLRVVAVIDVSMGADVVLARPGIKTVDDIRGKRVVCEQSAVGAVMLDAFLSSRQLKPGDVELSYATVNEHVDLYKSGKADIVVTFAPSAQAITALGAERLFDSAAIPGRVIDTLAVTGEALSRSGETLRKLIGGYFEVLSKWRRTPAAITPLLAEGLTVKPDEVANCFLGLELPDAMANRDWIKGPTSRLEKAAVELGRVMVAAKLLTTVPDLSRLVTDGFLPGESS